MEGDIFRIIVPLDDEFSYDSTEKNRKRVGERVGEKVGEKELSDNQRQIMEMVRENPYIKAKEMSLKIGISQCKIEENIRKLKEKQKIERIGSSRNGYYRLK